MKKVLFGTALALFGLITAAHAEYMVKVRGADYPISSLMQSCADANGGSDAQLKCFITLTGLVKEQAGAAQVNLSAADALDALRKVAQHQDADSGLIIDGAECRIQITYYNNYFHMSRRNVSSIDLVTAEFDAAQVQLDQVQRADAGGVAKGFLQLGGTAVSKGGAALESADLNFPTKPAQASMQDYVQTVSAQLATRQSDSFDFVLVHPKRSQISNDIWKAFDVFVRACQN